MSLAILFHFLCTQHVSDINISIIGSLRLFCWITTLVIFFLVRCVLEFRCGWFGVVSVLQAEAQLQHTPNKNNTTNVAIQQNSRKLLMMDILMSETCWAHKKWNKIASDIKLVFYPSTIRVKPYIFNFTVNEEQPLQIKDTKWGQMWQSAPNQSTDTTRFRLYRHLWYWKSVFCSHESVRTNVWML